MKRSEQAAYSGPTITDIFWAIHRVSGAALEALGAMQEPSPDCHIEVIAGEIHLCLSALKEATTRLQNIREESNTGLIPF